MLGGGKEAEEAEATASEGGLEWIVLVGSEWLQVGSWGEGDVGWSTVSEDGGSKLTVSGGIDSLPV